MQRTENRPYSDHRTAKDVETWLGNSLATILAALAVGAGVVGMLMVFEYINEDSTNPFQDGLAWMIGGLILAICANVFRREHHVVDSPDMRPRGYYTESSARTEPTHRERDDDFERVPRARS
jgi:hypothetical protein